MKDVQATGEASSPQREHPALQNMKYLRRFFLFLWVIFALLDPDPDLADHNQCGSMRIYNTGTKKLIMIANKIIEK
jgi:hypothetical protein